MNKEPPIDAVVSQFEGELSFVDSSLEIEQIRVKYLGKKGLFQALMQHLRDLPLEEKPTFGQKVNEAKARAETLIFEKAASISKKESASRLDSERVDVTLPGRRRSLGREHILSKTLDEAIEVCVSMGFTVQLGPDLDSDYYNFEGLNFPPDHPARDMQDSFYVDETHLLRSHTTNTQLRIMEKYSPPLRVISPGKVYRSENISSRSHVMFHQLDGMYIDKEVSLADLFGTMKQFWNAFFGRKCEVRFRPSFFPFVEPGMEVDIGCMSCERAGCRLCKYTGWLEVAGAGMIHPEVLKNGGIDPHEFSGFAWGMGIERPALLKYGIDDIRLFTENDLRFLEQFN